MLRFLHAAVLPFRYARLVVFYASLALSHPIGIAVAGFLLWRANVTPQSPDYGAFVLSLFGYFVLIAMPARMVCNLTRPPPIRAVPALPQETAWPASARVTVAVAPAAEEASPDEAEMWARLDPLLRRIAGPPAD